jgi:hypothetical protein
MNIWYLACILAYLFILDLRLAFSIKNKTNSPKNKIASHDLKNFFHSEKKNFTDDHNIKNNQILKDSGILI